MADASARWQELHGAGNVLLFAPKGQYTEEPSSASVGRIHERTTTCASAGVQHPQPPNRELLNACELRGMPDGVYVRTAGRVIARRAPASLHGFLWVSLEDETGISNIAVPATLQDRERLSLEAGSCLEVEGRVRNSKGGLHIEASRMGALGRGIPRPSDASL